MKRTKYWTACIDVIAHKRDATSHVSEPTDALVVPYGKSVTARTDVRTVMESLLAGLACEAVVLIMLDNSNRVIGGARLSLGTSTQCHITTKQIFSAALLSGATSIILAHNHPGGSTSPSAPDWSITKQTRTAGDALGIPLLDHVIVADDVIVSMRELNQWQ